MALDFLPSPPPLDVPALWERLVRLVLSLTTPKFITGQQLYAGRANLVDHGGRGRPPKYFSAQPVGTTASTAVLTKGAIGPQFVTLYTTADCVVDVEVVE